MDFNYYVIAECKKALHKECVHEQYMYSVHMCMYMYKQKLQLNHPTTTGSLDWKAITYTISRSRIVIITDNIFV